VNASAKEQRDTFEFNIHLQLEQTEISTPLLQKLIYSMQQNTV